MNNEFKLLEKVLSMFHYAKLICGYSRADALINYFLNHEDFSENEKSLLENYFEIWRQGKFATKFNINKEYSKEKSAMHYKILCIKYELEAADKRKPIEGLLGLLNQPGVIILENTNTI